MTDTAMTGEIRLYAGLNPPADWMPCDGRLLVVDEYSDLFVLIQTTYGGDGGEHFALPDLRGRVPLQWSPSIPIGAPGGAEQVTILPANMPAHTHPVSVGTGDATDPVPTGKQLAKTGGTLALYNSDPPSAALHADTLAVAPGGGQAHQNMPPYLVAGQYIICVRGIFPSRPGEDES